MTSEATSSWPWHWCDRERRGLTCVLVPGASWPLWQSHSWSNWLIPPSPLTVSEFSQTRNLKTEGMFAGFSGTSDPSEGLFPSWPSLEMIPWGPAARGPLGRKSSLQVYHVPSLGLSTTNWHLPGFPDGSDGKESVCNAGDLSSIPGSGRSPGEGNVYLFRYTCLENPMDRGVWRTVVHGVAKNRTQLSNWHFHFFIGTCHLPLQGLNQVLLYPLTFNTPWKELRVEKRNETLCSGKNWKNRSSDRYFQKPILWAQFLNLLISRKSLKSFMVMTAPC